MKSASAESLPLPSGQALPRLGVIVLSFNSAAAIRQTVRAALQVADWVQVVDSGSTDGTPALVQSLGAQCLQRPFTNYAEQRNWAIARFGGSAQWQLHLDADEVMDSAALAAVRQALADPQGASAFIFERRTYFMGRALRFGGASNYHLRLFKTGAARCEDRLYDQHFVCATPARRLGGLLHDMNVGNLNEWTARHNRWSEMEVQELRRHVEEEPAAPRQQINARLSADPRERRRLYKQGYYTAPPLWRALALFGYRYLLLGGFLDGRAGFYYAFFQALWFRMLVDAKLVERPSPGDAP